MKKYLIGALLAAAIIVNIATVAVSAEWTSLISRNGVRLEMPFKLQAEGRIRIKGSTANNKIKLLVTGAGQQIWYDVKLSKGVFDEEIWFDKPGKYTISVMVNEYDRKYSYGPEITIENTHELDKHLIPAKHIESGDAGIISTAKAITENCGTELEKARAIYDWVAENTEYDYEKLAKHIKGQYGNEYGAVNTLKTGKGVCYDYAALAAALARAVGIRAKLVEGELKQGDLKSFHAWNEFYIPERKAWINVDTTLGDTTGRDYFDFSSTEESYTAYEYK